VRYPCRRQEELGRMFLGQPVYLEPKGRGDNSILEKRKEEKRRSNLCSARPA
jgi:hypothetical protein